MPTLLGLSSSTRITASLLVSSRLSTVGLVCQASSSTVTPLSSFRPFPSTTASSPRLSRASLAPPQRQVFGSRRSLHANASLANHQSMSDPQVLSSRPQTSSECVADHLEQPSLDNRSYKVIRLSNKLEALLIHDPDTDKASAALDNNAGGFSDDDDLPGMAHAVEHLLFMGTKKYPKENEYNRYLTAHSGYSNAFTASTSTNYFFEISVTPEENPKAEQTNGTKGDHDAPLYGALDRFAQFFIEPLFLEETLDRELRAVDSENKKNLQSDTWRLHQLSKSLSNPDHPYNGFSTGNLKTLRDDPVARGVKIREEFMRFHREQYSANRMKLVVLGRESLSQLQSWVEELFSPVVNKDLPQNRWDGIPLFTPEQSQLQVFAKPVMDQRYMELTFSYPDEDDLYDSQPGHYLSHLIGHEGPGSILAYTKAKGWVDGLNAGSSSICPGSGKFGVTMTLTAEGLKHVEELAEIVFNYISILKQTEPQAWIFEEIKGLAEVDFKFKQKSPASRTTSALSQTMQDPIPRDRLLSGYSWPRVFDAAAVKRGLSHLSADKVRLTLVSSQDLPGEVKREKWYGTEHSVHSMPAELSQRLKAAEKANPLQELHLPHKNEFIPSNFDVEKKEVKEPTKAPKLIRNDRMVRLWYKKDDQFWVPKAGITATLRNSITGSSPHTVVMGLMIAYLVEDALTEYAYDAELAGLYYDMSGSYTGMGLSVGGYNDKLAVLLEKVLTTLKTLEIKEDRFEIMKERLTRAYKNQELNTPYYQIGTYTRWLSSEKEYTYRQLLVEVETLKLQDLRSFHPLLLEKFHIEALVNGNVYREDALKWANLIERILKPQPFPEEHWPARRAFNLPAGQGYMYETPLEDPLNVNHCIEYTVSIGSRDDLEARARLLLWSQLTEEPAFDQLRTKEQLGYVVFSGFSSNATKLIYHVLIQSERTPTYLEQRIDRFLHNFGAELRSMTQEQFESHKRSIINKRLERVKNLNQESGRFWEAISNRYYGFELVDEDVKRIKALSKQDMIDFYSHHIDPSSEVRAKLSVHMIAKATSPEDGAKTNPAELRGKLTALTSQLLATSGHTADEGKLKGRYESVDVAAGEPSAIVLALQKYCQEDAGMSDEEVKSISEQAQKAMPDALTQLGVASQANGDKQEEPVKTKPMEKIEDAHLWKTGLSLSAGARPFKSLSAYEDLSKL